MMFFLLVCIISLTDRHDIEIEVLGHFDEKANRSFKCTSIRSNPALVGAVTGNATYASFFNSILGNCLVLKLLRTFS